MLKILKTYKKRLANLTTKNRSLLLLRPSVRHFIDISSFHFIDKSTSFPIIESLISEKKSRTLCPIIDPRDGNSNALSKHLKGVWKTDQMLQAETGSEDLFVGYPFVQGKFLDGTLVRCPLLFFPVQLIQKNNQWIMEQKDLPVSFNRTFLMAYSQLNKVTLEDSYFEKNGTDFGSETKVFLTQLYEYLKESSLEINFNSSLFNERLESFELCQKSDFDEIKIGELKLASQAVLGIFPQAGSFIAADYDELITNDFHKDYDSIESYMLENRFEKPIIKEENLHLPLPVDASQEEAIRRIKKGESMVIQGPPGTGKSQLICNLMADYAAEGKRVLLVCQKRAAIDTVNKRLKGVGMQNFTALVHDYLSDRKALYENISFQIGNTQAYKHENQGLNTIFLEREFVGVCRKIDKIVKDLAAFKNALFDDKSYGKSVKELYLIANHKTEKEINLKDIFPFFHYSSLSNFLQKLDTLERYQKSFYQENEAYEFWQKRKSFEGLRLHQFSELCEAITKLAEVKGDLNKLGESFDLANSVEINIIQKFFVDYSEDKTYAYIKKASENIISQEKLKSLINEVSAIFENLDNNQNLSLGYIHASIETVSKAQIATSNLAKKIFWTLFSKGKFEVFELVIKFGLEADLKSLIALEHLLNQHIRLHEISKEIDFEYNNSNLLNELNEQLNGHIFYTELSSISRTKIDLMDKGKLDIRLKKWLGLQNVIQTSKDIWGNLITIEQINLINLENQILIIDYLKEHFDNLQARDNLYAELTAIEKSCYILCKNQFHEKLAENFESNLILHFVEDLENKEPILRTVSSLQMQLWEEDLQSLILKKQQFSNEILLLKLRENTYKNIEKNRIGNATTYRDLLHQTTKKKQLWPIRKLVTEFSHELFDLVPCWMASPETVSAIFPILNKNKFDLVIFDEASQCFAEKGFPAMLRGKQIVITGDKKQLQPNDLYRIKIEEDAEESPLLEIESLLELGSNFLPETILRGHYRSKSLDLIDFSNNHFYDHKLKLLPDFSNINEGVPAIDFIKVDGVWDRNQNMIEAQKVLELAKDMDARKSIGVVTFNAQQADLIQDLTQEIENISVKNIENIQGDEFDVVFFSMAYAPDKNGKFRMNFGSLNQKGGENRLNVAITRAREKIIIVCSLLPQDLKVDKSINEGPKLLKDYLSYAQNVSNGNFQPSLPVINEQNWGKFLKNEITKSGSNFETSLPFTDLVRMENNTFKNLILTDDQIFYSAESIKESFAYLPLMLQTKGWNYIKSWSRNWWKKPIAELSLLEEKVAKE